MIEKAALLSELNKIDREFVSDSIISFDLEAVNKEISELHRLRIKQGPLIAELRETSLLLPGNI